MSQSHFVSSFLNLHHGSGVIRIVACISAFEKTIIFEKIILLFMCISVWLSVYMYTTLEVLSCRG